MGIYLVGFLALQRITGIYICLWTLMDAPGTGFWFTTTAWIHRGWKPMGSVYRILLGTVTAAQGLGGLALYLIMRSRLNKS